MRQATGLEMVLWIAGWVSTAWALWKSRIAGYHQDETPMILGTLVAATLLFVAASAMRRKRRKAMTEAMDRAKGIQ